MENNPRPHSETGERHQKLQEEKNSRERRGARDKEKVQLSLMQTVTDLARYQGAQLKYQDQHPRCQQGIYQEVHTTWRVTATKGPAWETKGAITVESGTIGEETAHGKRGRGRETAGGDEDHRNRLIDWRMGGNAGRQRMSTSWSSRQTGNLLASVSRMKLRGRIRRREHRGFVPRPHRAVDDLEDLRTKHTAGVLRSKYVPIVREEQPQLLPVEFDPSAHPHRGGGKGDSHRAADDAWPRPCVISPQKQEVLL
ncbi:unnamed protein product [Lota lota]